MFYPMFRFGSPLVWEDRIPNFKADKEIELSLDKKIKQSFRAESNNLGTIGLRIAIQDLISEEDEEVNGKEDIDEEMFSEKREKIVFRIKEDKKEIKDYFYENTYELIGDFENSYFLFGFPIQKESNGKSYVFEIERIEKGESNKTFLIEKNSENKLNFYPRYVYSLKEIKSDYNSILSNISRKTSQFLEERTNQVNLIFTFLLIEIFIFCFLKKEEKYFKKRIYPYFKYVFLVTLFLVSLFSLRTYLTKIDYLENIMVYFSTYSLLLIILTVSFGFLSIYFDKREVEREIRYEKYREDILENKRCKNFKEKFPVINKIPMFGTFFRYIYKENWRFMLGLLLILTAFTAIKAPYFNTSFTGEHSMKYNTYVEPAKYMYEYNNPFWIQRKYHSSPVNNPQGIFKTFGSPPIIEWGLFLTYKVFPHNSIEFNTRLFTHFLGILILIFAYVFFSKWLTKIQSLLVIFLMAINPIINFLSFVTIEDSLLFIFMFLSLIYLSNFIKSKNISNLFLAGLFFGIGNTCKYSLFLWFAPISFVLLVLHAKNKINFLRNFTILIGLSLIPIIAFRNSLSYLPTNMVLSIVSFVIWVIVFIAIYYLLKKYDKKLEDFFGFLIRRKIFFISGLIIVFFSGATFLYFTEIYRLSNQFLTDPKLIFNWDMYKYILNKQLKSYMTENVYCLGLIGFGFYLFSKLKKQKILFLSFFLGSLIYWILASKVIFFHSYYTTIIMVTFCLTIGIMIYLIGKSFKNKFLFIALILLIILLVTPGSVNVNVNRLRKTGDTESLKQAAQYLIENTREDEIYIDSGNNQYLTILTNRAQTRDYCLDKPEIKKSIKETGFSKTMDKYNISYIVTALEEPEYERYVNLFTDEDLKPIIYNRTDIILSKLNSNYKYFPDLDVRNELIEKYNVKDKFVLEKEIGPYKFFKFVD